MKTTTLRLAPLALAIFACSFTGQAQEKKREIDFDKMITRFDADENGSVSLEEFKSAKRKREVDPERLEKMFANLDGDSNGEVTLEELKANWSKNREKGKGRKGNK